MVTQLHKMKPNKAPGPDTVPAWVWRLVIDPKPVKGNGDGDDDSGEGGAADDDDASVEDGVDGGGVPEVGAGVAVGTQPKSKMGATLFKLLTFMWRYSVIPDDWNLATLVPIPKKGDLMVMGNHRPIALMSVALKVLCGVVKQRFEAATDASLPRSQAGFRSKEECVAQAVVVHDAVRRRLAKSQSSIVILWDLQKAYDKVQSRGLLAKMERFGFTGRMLAFVEALYANPRIRVRLESGVVSREVDVGVGVRQGDLPSPCFFNFFIADLGEALAALPGRCSVPGMETRVGECFFADDLVTIAESVEAVAAQVETVETWCRDNGMRVNASKCSMLVVSRTECTAGAAEGPSNTR